MSTGNDLRSHTRPEPRVGAAERGRGRLGWATVSAPASTLDPALAPVVGIPANTAPRRRTGVAAWVLLVGLFPLARLAVFLGKPAALQQREFMDDFYYYALIARSLADGDGSTFTG